MKKSVSTLIVVSLFAAVIAVSILTNRSSCRMLVYKIETRIELLASK